MNPNICHDRKLIFVHNPKAAGMSFRQWLGFDGVVNHGVPTVNVPYQLWNSYTVVVVIRDPLERALSCYSYLTGESYRGAFTNMYTDIKSWDPLHFFHVMTTEQLFVCACQYKYTQHFQSNKSPDFLFRVESMDTGKLAEKFNLSSQLPKVNVGSRKKIEGFSKELYAALVDYYKVDYLLFGYRPVSYEDFMERHLQVA
ncbi:MAG: hypothetical protein ROO70_14310 [Labrenzia sp.]